VRAKIWGSRGSLATPGIETLRYGGNTPCVEVRLADGTLVILDAGTGIRPLGLALGPGEPGEIHLCLTHLHLDHLEGLPFFVPLWRTETEVQVWGPPSPVKSLEERIARYFSPPLFPRELAEVPARLTFHDAPGEEWKIGSARIFAEPVAHPGATLGYRIEEDGYSLAYIPDHEPALAGDLETASPDWISGFAVAERASVLLHDAQFFEHEYPSRVGWGHSSVAHTVAFARASRAERLLLFHHDPLHGDADLETLQARSVELWGNDGAPPSLASEGMEIAIG
jgi:phosphoribosyl 1,2-cyclic phosphodiesterase